VRWREPDGDCVTIVWPRDEFSPVGLFVILCDDRDGTVWSGGQCVHGVEFGSARHLGERAGDEQGPVNVIAGPRRCTEDRVEPAPSR
jgi:hypothetical protein